MAHGMLPAEPMVVEDAYPDVGQQLLSSDDEDHDDGSQPGAPLGAPHAARRSWPRGLPSSLSWGRTGGILGIFAVVFVLVALSSDGLSLVRPLRAKADQTVGLQAMQQQPNLAAIKASYPGWDPSYWDDLMSGKAGGSGDSDSVVKQCRDDEEEFGGLCYKRCTILTGNQYPIRTTAFTCCEKSPCHPFNSKKDFGFCSGYSVGGGEGENCPHPPGTCLSDEEELLGTCYKKCSLLTNGEFPHRLTNMACCKVSLSYKCLYPSNIRARKEFDVAGGKGDGDASTSGSQAAAVR